MTYKLNKTIKQMKYNYCNLVSDDSLFKFGSLLSCMIKSLNAVTKSPCLECLLVH